MGQEQQNQKTPQERALDSKLAELDAKMTAMLDLETRLKATAPVGGIDAAQLETILTKVTEAAAGPSQLLASKLRPENSDHRHLGPFEHPDGGIAKPKADLPREVHFMGRVRLDDISYVEWDALMKLNASLARGQRRECRNGTWKAIVSDNDQILTISVPMKSIDDRHDLPSFLQIVQELTTGARALDQAELAAQVALLSAKVSELSGAAV